MTNDSGHLEAGSLVMELLILIVELVSAVSEGVRIFVEGVLVGSLKLG